MHATRSQENATGLLAKAGAEGKCAEGSRERRLARTSDANGMVVLVRAIAEPAPPMTGTRKFVNTSAASGMRRPAPPATKTYPQPTCHALPLKPRINATRGQENATGLLAKAGAEGKCAEGSRERRLARTSDANGMVVLVRAIAEPASPMARTRKRVNTSAASGMRMPAPPAPIPNLNLLLRSRIRPHRHEHRGWNTRFRSIKNPTIVWQQA